MIRILNLLAIFSLLLPLPTWGAGAVIINEIAWMGSLPKSGETATQASNNEWMELKNTGANPIDLGGWKLTAEDGTPDIVLAGTIAASGFFLLERTSDDTILGIKADQIYVGALSNSGEILVLRDAAGNEIDKVDGSDGWKIKGVEEVVGNNETKETAQRVTRGWITASSTPRAENMVTVASLSSAAASSAPALNLNSGSVSSAAFSIPLSFIKVYAGDDRVVAAGSLTDFIGEALGADNKPLENPRFWWNFGDGDSKEGRVATHIFQVPGKYMVGLHVSSGSNAVSDYLKVEVIPNQIKVASVLIGKEGYLTIFNPADVDIDIGEWVLEDGAGRKFFIPSRTKIGAKSETSFSNRTTGILGDGAARAILSYPNSVVAYAYERQEKVVLPGQVFPVVPTPSLNKVVKVETKFENVPSLLRVEAVDSTPAVSAQVSQISAGVNSKIFFWSALALSLLAALSFLLFKLKL